MNFEYCREKASRLSAGFLHGYLRRSPRAPNITGDLLIDVPKERVTFACIDVTGTEKQWEESGEDLVERSGLTHASKSKTHDLIRRISKTQRRAFTFVRFQTVTEPCLLEVTPLFSERRRAAFPDVRFHQDDMAASLRIWHLGGLAGVFVSPTPRTRSRLKTSLFGLFQICVAVGVYCGCRYGGWDVGSSLTIATAAAGLLLPFRPRNPPKSGKPLSRFLTSANLW